MTSRSSTRPPAHPSAHPSLFSPRSGAVLQALLGAVTIGVIGWAGVVSMRVSMTAAPASRTTEPANAIEVEAALGALGLTPKVLAAAGLTAQQTASFTDAAATSMHSDFTAYRTAQEAAGTAAREIDRLRRLIRSGSGTQQDAAALAAAITSLNTARAQQQTILADALAQGGQEIPAPTLAKLNLFRAHKLLWDLPERYLGDERSEEQWVNLRDAIANDDIATRLNQEPDQAAHQLLLSAQSTPNSSAAATNLANLAEIKAAWNQALIP